jgi:hypothetical protein
VRDGIFGAHCRILLRSRPNITSKLSAVASPVRTQPGDYQESFYVGFCCFLKGKTDGIYYLPLQTGGFERLVFSRRTSSGGYSLLRIDPLRWTAWRGLIVP